MNFRSPHLSSAFLNTVLAIAAFNSPAIASAQASPAPSTSASHATPKTHPADSSLDAGSINAGVYRNPSLAFTCKIPSGWVLRTEEMNARDREDASGAPAKDADNARVLFAAFSRPPEARGEDINSSILIAAESLSAYPGLKGAAQYFGPVTEVAKAQGFVTDEDPYDFAVGTKSLVRADFEKNVGTRVMRQSTLVMLARGYAVSFTFIAGTEDEVEELVQGLSFAAAKPNSR
jgi:hypothetical protein